LRFAEHVFDNEPMLIYRRTSLLESSAQTLVNTVNCVGVMGKGLAQAFKDREPDMFSAYKKVCEQGLLEPGKLWLWRGADSWTLNFPTKKHWRNPSKLDWVESGLKKFAAAYEAQGIKEISFPRLGCGNGGLDWEDVRPLMEHYLLPLPIPIFIHDYSVDIGLPEHLERIAETIRKAIPANPTFETFMESLKRAVELGGSEFVELSTNERFGASMDEVGDLRIEASEGNWEFEPEDLRGVWYGLQKGLVTKEKASWSVAGGGRPLLSILSVLPHVRPIQIQRSNSDVPELAVELTPETRRIVAAPQSEAQRELAWH
jgi:O-acetyl-ADP-ribose deacetylase (regulator of RNase III)